MDTFTYLNESRLRLINSQKLFFGFFVLVNRLVRPSHYYTVTILWLSDYNNFSLNEFAFTCDPIFTTKESFESARFNEWVAKIKLSFSPAFCHKSAINDYYQSPRIINWLTFIERPNEVRCRCFGATKMPNQERKTMANRSIAMIECHVVEENMRFVRDRTTVPKFITSKRSYMMFTWILIM